MHCVFPSITATSSTTRNSCTLFKSMKKGSSISTALSSSVLITVSIPSSTYMLYREDRILIGIRTHRGTMLHSGICWTTKIGLWNFGRRLPAITKASLGSPGITRLTNLQKRRRLSSWSFTIEWLKPSVKSIRIISVRLHSKSCLCVVFLDANTFGSDFSFLRKDTTQRWKSWSGIVYSVHDYCKYGFPGLRYAPTPQNRAYLERSFERKCSFMRENNLPIWNGEFGPVYDSRGLEKDAINSERYQMLKDQLSLYKEKQIVGWSIWTYKDIGFQGNVCAEPSLTQD